MKPVIIKACSYLNLAHQLPLNKACSRQDIYPVLSWCTVLAKMKACCQVWGQLLNLLSPAFTVKYRLCPHPSVQRTSSAGLGHAFSWHPHYSKESTFNTLFCVPSEMSHPASQSEDSPPKRLNELRSFINGATFATNANLLLVWNTHHCELCYMSHISVSSSFTVSYKCFIPQLLLMLPTFSWWC